MLEIRSTNLKHLNFRVDWVEAYLKGKTQLTKWKQIQYQVEKVEACLISSQLISKLKFRLNEFK